MNNQPLRFKFLNITKRAERELLLIMENDFTVKDKAIRLTIEGKGCNGFNYGIGFDTPTPTDLHYSHPPFNFILDPFVAQYINRVSIDFILDVSNNRDGFVVLNHDEEKYQGKFWMKES